MGDVGTFAGKWRLFAHIESHCVILMRYYNKVVSYAPLYEHVFQVIQPYTLYRAEVVNFLPSSYMSTASIGDRLRMYRYQKGMRQADVAAAIGIERSTYTGYEEGRDYYPFDKMKRLAEVFEIPVTALLDDYNSFLRQGQGEQIKALRHSLGLTVKEFAKMQGVSKSTVKRWESGTCMIYKSTWEKLFSPEREV